MKNKRTITAALIMLIGGMIICGAVMISIGFDFSRLSTVAEPEYKSQTFSATDISDIVIHADSQNVEVVRSEGNNIQVEYYLSDKFDCQISVEDGQLNITCSSLEPTKEWYDLLTEVNFYPNTYRMMVHIPSSFGGELTLN